MDYQWHYDRLMDRARRRVLPGYRERHHVVPRCLGGPDTRANRVDLTAEEHYVAHKLLVCLYPGHQGLVNALWLMGGYRGRRRAGWMREQHARKPRTWNAKISAAKKGVRFTEAHKAALRAAKNPRNSGKHHSEETRTRISAAQKGKPRGPHSMETRAKMSASHRRHQTEETKAKIRATWQSEEYRRQARERVLAVWKKRKATMSRPTRA